MLKRLIHRAAAGLARATDQAQAPLAPLAPPAPSTPADPGYYTDPRPQGYFPGNESGLEQARRQRDEYREACYSLQNQRDRYRAMYKQHSLGHMNAVALYDEAAIKNRRMLKSAWDTINRLRERIGLEPLADLVAPIDLEAPPVGTAKEYARELAELYEGRPRDTSAATELAQAEERVHQQMGDRYRPELQPDLAPPGAPDGDQAADHESLATGPSAG